MPPVGFEPTISVGERPKTYALDRAATGTGRKDKIRNTIIKQKINVIRSVLDDIKTKQLQLYGHVQRMEEGRLPKKL